MAPLSVVRKEQYSTNGHLEIRAVGTEEWYKPSAYEGFYRDGPSNIVRPSFKPGSISVFQQVAKPDYALGGHLNSASYMWKATFNVADLQEIHANRVKELQYGHSTANASFRIRIEILAVCKAPPTGSGLVVPKGVHTSNVYHKAEDASEPTASSIALANLSDRWASGEQEIKLSFTRTTRVERKAGKNKPQQQTESVTGPKVWIWHAFLAFLCGVEWEARNKDAVVVAAQKSLEDIVGLKFGNSYAEFEKREDNWAGSNGQGSGYGRQSSSKCISIRNINIRGRLPSLSAKRGTRGFTTSPSAYTNFTGTKARKQNSRAMSQRLRTARCTTTT